MTTDPRDMLRAAAARLREMAAEARVSVGDAPWLVQLMRDHTYGIWTEGTTFDGGDDQLASVNTEEHARWIAALSPAVAEPLATWLEDEAERWGNGWSRLDIHNALAFARLIRQTEGA